MTKDNMTPEAITAYEADRRDLYRNVINGSIRRNRSIVEFSGCPNEFRPDTRKHPMEMSEVVKRNLAACMTLATYIP